MIAFHTVNNVLLHLFADEPLEFSCCISLRDQHELSLPNFATVSPVVTAASISFLTSGD